MVVGHVGVLESHAMFKFYLKSLKKIFHRNVHPFRIDLGQNHTSFFRPHCGLCQCSPISDVEFLAHPLHFFHCDILWQLHIALLVVAIFVWMVDKFTLPASRLLPLASCFLLLPREVEPQELLVRRHAEERHPGPRRAFLQLLIGLGVDLRFQARHKHIHQSRHRDRAELDFSDVDEQSPLRHAERQPPGDLSSGPAAHPRARQTSPGCRA